MSKLSDEVLDEGRGFIIRKDLDGFIRWIEKNRIEIDTDMVRKTYRRCFAADDLPRALRIFDKVFPNIDPEAQRAAGWIRFGCLLFVALGLLGGVMFLIQLFVR